VVTLEVDGVCVRREGREILRAVRFSAAPGRLVAVVGPNGAGKTTLLRVAAGLLEPDEGAARVGGRPVARLDRREAARLVAYAPAEEEPCAAFRVREAVALGRHPWRGPFAPLARAERDRVDRAIGAMRLEALAARPMGTLSSGERQRATLARVLAQDAPVLLFDEPTAHQDLGRRVEVLETLRGVARERVVIAVLHDLALAGLVAERVLLLADGAVVADGTPREVLTRERVERAFDARVEVLTRAGGAAAVLPATRSDA
jgi:iron complex transport system ATP-binding protein